MGVYIKEEFDESYEGIVREDIDINLIKELIEELREEKVETIFLKKKTNYNTYRKTDKGIATQERRNAKKREIRRVKTLLRKMLKNMDKTGL